ncbi:hypothetical protein Gohar_000983, partial [Gossypium harknessii]|nr:hypothetical protein [Gossypium harknessii]
LWKTTKKFDIKDAGQNLLLITFKDEVNLELILEWRPLSLRRRVFTSKNSNNKLWVPFKYELLTASCYDCGHIGHGIKDCSKICEEQRAKLETSITIALKAESNLKGKENHTFLFEIRNKLVKKLYIGQVEEEEDQRFLMINQSTLINSEKVETTGARLMEIGNWRKSRNFGEFEQPIFK